MNRLHAGPPMLNNIIHIISPLPDYLGPAPSLLHGLGFLERLLDPVLELLLDQVLVLQELAPHDGAVPPLPGHSPLG